jgi:hypothetical protein
MIVEALTDREIHATFAAAVDAAARWLRLA